MDEKKELKEESNAPVEKAAVITNGDEVYIDLEGKSGKEEFAKALIPNDAYDGTVISVALQNIRAYNSDKMIKKFLFSILIDGQKDKDGNEVMLPLFVKTTISKAYGPGVSNSKLFDILEEAGLLGEIEGMHSAGKVTEEMLRGFLESRLQSKSVRVEVKTSNEKNPDKESYSTVKSILRFEPEQEAE